MDFKGISPVCCFYIIMKRVYLTFILLLFSCSLFAQVIDTLQLRVQYKSVYRTTIEQSDERTDLQFLDIGKHSSHFYSQRYILTQQKIDSVRRVVSDPMDRLIFAAEQYGKQGQPYHLWKSVPKQDKYIYADIVSLKFGFYYVDKLTEPLWSFVAEERVIAGFTCYKAECTYKGRKWTVFYTLDIPYQNGPWLLGGLPGLVLSARDDKGYFTFECVGIEQKAKEAIPMKLDLNLYEKTTRKKFIALLKEYWLDQFNTGNRLRGQAYSEPPSAQRVFTSCFIDNE